MEKIVHAKIKNSNSDGFNSNLSLSVSEDTNDEVLVKIAVLFEECGCDVDYTDEYELFCKVKDYKKKIKNEKNNN